MARVWSSGAELGTTAASVEFASCSGTVQSTVKRSGTYAIRFNPTAAEQNIVYNYRSADTQEAVFVRAYVRLASAPSSTIYAISLLGVSAGAHKAQLRINSSRQVILYNAEDSAQVGSIGPTLSLDTWYRLELKLDSTTLASTAIEGKVDGTTFASDTINLTGGTARVAFGGFTATHDTYIDDFAINDSSGTAQTSWPGEGSIVHLKPNAAGDNAMGLNQGSAPAATGWESVDEVTPDDAVTYHNLDANNDILDVNLESSATAGIGASDAITLVQVGERHNGASASNYTYNTRIKSQASGTVISGTAVTTAVTSFGTNTGANPRNYQLTRYTDPQAGGAWTTSLLDTTQIGVIATDAAPDVYISTLWALVEYVPTPPDATGTVSAGSLSVAGQTVTATADTLATVATGSHAVAGQAITADPAVAGSVATGAHAVSGQTVGAVAGSVATVATGSHAVAGQAVAGAADALATVATGSHAVSGQAVAGQADTLASIGTGGHAVSGQAITGEDAGTPATGEVATGTLAVSGQPVTGVEGAAPVTGQIAAGSFAVSGQAVGAETGTLATVASGDHAVAGQTVTAQTGTTATVATGTLAAVGQIVAASVDELVSLVAGTLSVSGQPIAGTSETVATIATGELAVAGQDVTAIGAAPMSPIVTFLAARQPATIVAGRSPSAFAAGRAPIALEAGQPS